MNARSKETKITIGAGGKESASGSLRKLCLAVPMAALIYALLAFSSYRIFRLAELGVGGWLFGVAGVCVLTVVLLCGMAQEKVRDGFVSYLFLFLPALLFIGLAAFLFSDFRHGFNTYLDQLALLRTGLTARIQTRFDRGPDPQGAATVFSVFYAFLLAALAKGIVWDRRRFAVALMLLLFAAAAAAGFAGNAAAGLALGAACLLGILLQALLTGDAGDRLRGVLQGSGLILLFLAVAGLIGLVLQAGVLPDSVALRERTESRLHAWRYEENENPLPEGDLRTVGAFQPTGRTTLIVSMSRPEATYLRGCTGEVYRDGVWRSLTAEDYAENSDLFYYLHQDGFYGQSQRAAVFALSGEAEEAEAMTIVNRHACRAYTYLPYGFYQPPGEALITDPAGIGDAGVQAPGLRGRGAGGESAGDAGLQLSYLPRTVRASYVVQRDLMEDAAPSPELAAYERDEMSYREMVYRSYLDIPEDIEELLERELGNRYDLSTSRAKIRILEYLDQNVVYRQDVTGNRGQELLSWFLGRRKAGYSVHYAAAAAMMLRYYGIPSRYVEGYVIKAGKAASAEPGEAIELTERDAHAWAEYYLDGIGWVPFETTPGYRDPNMYAAAGLPDTREGTSDSGTASQTAEGIDEEEDLPVSDENDFDNPINNWRRIFAFRKIWGAALAAGILLVLIIITWLRRKKLKRFLGTFQDRDRRRAAVNAFGYAVFLIRHRVPEADLNRLRETEELVAEKTGLGESYRRALDLNDRCRYSGKEVPEETRAAMLGFQEQVLREYRAERNLFQRLYDRLVLCIY